MAELARARTARMLKVMLSRNYEFVGIKQETEDSGTTTTLPSCERQLDLATYTNHRPHFCIYLTLFLCP